MTQTGAQPGVPDTGGPGGEGPGTGSHDLAATATQVLVPRTGHHRIADALRRAGAEVLEATLTRTVPLDVEAGSLDPDAVAWVLVTSARTVERLRDLEVGGRPWPAAVAGARAGGTRVGSVGPATSAALRAAGVEVDVEAPEGTAASLLTVVGAPEAEERVATGDGTPSARRVLLPASALADPATAASLTAAGWEVSAVAVYTTVAAEPPSPDVAAAIDPWPDVVVLTAPSTLDALLTLAGRPPDPVALVAIGPTTAAAVRAAGLRPAAVAQAPTPEAVVNAVVGLAATGTAVEAPTATTTAATITPDPSHPRGTRRRP
ncbi:MAG: uroporphyrinogen-III synthase [Actinomycetaceae bacterium]